MQLSPSLICTFLSYRMSLPVYKKPGMLMNQPQKDSLETAEKKKRERSITTQRSVRYWGGGGGVSLAMPFPFCANGFFSPYRLPKFCMCVIIHIQRDAHTHKQKWKSTQTHAYVMYCLNICPLS